MKLTSIHFYRLVCYNIMAKRINKKLSELRTGSLVIGNYSFFGFCFFIPFNESISDMKELISYKPTEYYNAAYWFNPADFQTREKILKEVIDKMYTNLSMPLKLLYNIIDYFNLLK